MMSSRVFKFLFLVSGMTSQTLVKGMVAEKIGIVEGIAQKIEELPKEVRYKIFSYTLALRENPKYEVYKKFDIGSQVRRIALNEDNTRALIASYDGLATLWDVEKGDVLIELRDYTHCITPVALSSDGALALTGSWDGTARIWNTLTGETMRILKVGVPVNAVALSADGALALTGSEDGIGRLYNTSTGALLKVLKGRQSSFIKVALSADGSLALTASYRGKVLVWNALTGKPIRTLQTGASVIAVALSADGALALTGVGDSKVLVWDVKAGVLLNTLLTDRGSILSIALSKNGKRILTSTADTTIQVWNTKPLPGKKETTIPLALLKGHNGQVIAVEFGRDDFIATGSQNNSALIWKPFALEPQGPQEHEEILWQAYKETFSRPVLRSTNGD